MSLHHPSSREARAFLCPREQLTWTASSRLSFGKPRAQTVTRSLGASSLETCPGRPRRWFQTSRAESTETLLSPGGGGGMRPGGAEQSSTAPQPPRLQQQPLPQKQSRSLPKAKDSENVPCITQPEVFTGPCAEVRTAAEAHKGLSFKKFAVQALRGRQEKLPASSQPSPHWTQSNRHRRSPCLYQGGRTSENTKQAMLSGQDMLAGKDETEMSTKEMLDVNPTFPPRMDWRGGLSQPCGGVEDRSFIHSLIHSTNLY